MGENTNENNPLLQKFSGPHGSIPYASIKTEHFVPAIEEGIRLAKENLEKIKANPDEASFENACLALESLSETLDLASSVYFNLFSAEADADLQALAKEISPKIAAYSNDVSLDAKLFERIKTVYEKRDSLELTGEQLRILEKQYKSFTRNGALLSDEDKDKLRKIDEELSKLGPQFSENLLNAGNSYVLPLNDESEIEGLPQSAVDALAQAAEERETGTKWAVTLDFPVFGPFVKYSSRRDLREKVYMAFATRAVGGEYDNGDNLKRIATLRFERAQLLGFDTHADYVLAERMAGSKKTVLDFEERILNAAKPKALEEVEEVKAFKKELGDEEELAPWDFNYYSEKLREKKYDLDEEKLRPYFKLENSVQGMFDLAGRLFDLDFKEVTNVDKYHEDVKTYEVYSKVNNDFIGLFYTDFFPRKTKRSGAWMTPLQEQGMFRGEVRRPHISIVCNFTKPTKDKPSLLTFNEVNTLLHEFGHALHGLLSQCTYRSVAGTNVYWDFVELPSQFMENWLLEKEVLDTFAKHYETGELIPAEMVEKLQAARKFQAAYMNMRQISFGLLDMAWHSEDPRGVSDIFDFEEKAMAKTRVLPKVPGTASSHAFAHIFAGGYSSGYYSYKWAEVLDADAYEHFKANGLFNKEIADSYKDNVLSRGGTEHPMELYKRFRGREPDPDALLRRDGLI